MSEFRQTSGSKYNKNDDKSFVQKNYSAAHQASGSYNEFDKPKSNVSLTIKKHRPPPPPPHLPETSLSKGSSINQVNTNYLPAVQLSSNQSTNQASPPNKLRSQSNVAFTEPPKSKNMYQQKAVIQHRRAPPPPPSNAADDQTPKQNVNYASNNVNGNDHSDQTGYERPGDDPYNNQLYDEPTIAPELPPINDNNAVKRISSDRRFTDDKLYNQHKSVGAESDGLEVHSSSQPNQMNTNRIEESTNNHGPGRAEHTRYDDSLSNENAVIKRNFNDIPLSTHRRAPVPPSVSHTNNGSTFPARHNSLGNGRQKNSNDEQTSLKSNFMFEFGALIVVCIISMVLVLAIREEETSLRATMQVLYSYLYLVSTVWMVWCMSDIIAFRRQWRKDIDKNNQEENYETYGTILNDNKDRLHYFPDVHNTGGLFMRVGAGVLCMGGLILTIIELSKTVTTPVKSSGVRALSPQSYPLSIVITKSMTYILRFAFHCVQFVFLFRYGNLVIARYYNIAKFCVMHVIIANFCTWFEAIVIETLEQIHKSSDHSSVSTPMVTTTNNAETTASFDNSSSGDLLSFVRAAAPSAAEQVQSYSNKTIHSYIVDIESSVNVYLYPCLIEYSLISLTVFYIMWTNIGKSRLDNRIVRFDVRNTFTVNCARASRGLLIGGIILLLTILTLIPTYILPDATTITHITESILLVVSLCFVCASLFYTSSLSYDREGTAGEFDQALILITTIGDFAYSFFGLYASIFVNQSLIKLPIALEISISLLSILETFLQTTFILDGLRRHVKEEQVRDKPGRETITALLLVNIAIWLHDSLSAKKVKLNPVQTAYYDASTWAIIQAFTSPLSIFYRFHSSVCLADIWQDAFEEKRHSNSGSHHVQNEN